MIAENLAAVHARITAACARAGRDPSSVTLINVSKTKPVEQLMEAYQAGERVFGENKVQEILEKSPLMPPDVHWHMIGHLQRNKVRQVIDQVDMIHSVDSLRLAETIEQEAARKNLIIPVLVEVNVAQEISKFGLSVEDAPDLILQLSRMPHIRVSGLMTIAPFVENPEKNRPVFRKLNELSVDILQKNINNVNMDVLSMGMTGDFEVAIEEGATMVRVGTGIFGERNQSSADLIR